MQAALFDETAHDGLDDFLVVTHLKKKMPIGEPFDIADFTLADPFGRTRVLGTVEAGFPSPAEEELTDTMSLDEWLIGNKEATFMLKVRGESMQGAGIIQGDMVLVERGVTPREGDIVIAEVDGAWTMKYLRHRNGRVMLEPANPKFRPIFPSEELNIAAVVKAVIRKY